VGDEHPHRTTTAARGATVAPEQAGPHRVSRDGQSQILLDHRGADCRDRRCSVPRVFPRVGSPYSAVSARPYDGRAPRRFRALRSRPLAPLPPRCTSDFTGFRVVPALAINRGIRNPFGRFWYNLATQSSDRRRRSLMRGDYHVQRATILDPMCVHDRHEQFSRCYVANSSVDTTTATRGATGAVQRGKREPYLRVA
jgi:hypothetical protein